MGRSSKTQGNKFQEDFFKSVPSNLYVERYKDSPVHYKKVHNPADYWVNSGCYVLLVECKTTKDDRLPLINIQMEQVWKMINACCKLNTFGGLLINFRKYNQTYFVFIEDFVFWYLNTTSKSLPIPWIRENGYRVSQKVKITRWQYGIQGLLNWVKGVKYDGGGV